MLKGFVSIYSVPVLMYLSLHALCSLFPQVEETDKGKTKVSTLPYENISIYL